MHEHRHNYVRIPCVRVRVYVRVFVSLIICCSIPTGEVGAGVETQKNVRREIGGWGRVPFNETYAPSLSTIYDGA